MKINNFERVINDLEVKLEEGKAFDIWFKANCVEGEELESILKKLEKTDTEFSFWLAENYKLTGKFKSYNKNGFLVCECDYLNGEKQLITVYQ